MTYMLNSNSYVEAFCLTDINGLVHISIGAKQNIYHLCVLDVIRTHRKRKRQMNRHIENN